MKAKNRKILSFICAIIILLSSTCTNLGILSSSVYASTEDISISEDELLNENELVSNEETTINENEKEAEENISSKTDEIVDENTEEIEEKEASKDDFNDKKEELKDELEDKEILSDVKNSDAEDVEDTLDDEDLLLFEDYGIMPLANVGEVSSVQYYGSISYGGSTVGNFAVNGKQAFCMAHSKKTPPTGTVITSSIYDNENIAKCLYYGWTGDGQWAGFTSGNMGIVMTSLALDYFYNGNNHKVATPFINFVNSQPSPSQRMTFSNNNLIGIKISDNEQATDTVTLLGDSRYSVSFTLQDGVNLHNTTKGAILTGRVTLNGGDSFFLTAPLDIKGSWTSENIGSAAYKYNTILWKTASSIDQDIIQQLTPEVDPTHYINLSINWADTVGGEVVELPETPSSLEIKKVDETGTPLSGATFKIWNDGDYNKTARTDSSGTISLSDLDSSKTTYYQETSAPYGYLLDDTVYSIEATTEEGEEVFSAREGTGPIVNIEPTGSLTITKEDSLTGNSMRIDEIYHHGDASIEGAVYTLYANGRITNRSGSRTYFNAGDEVATFTFDERGVATVRLLSYSGKLRANGSTLEGIPLGSYYLEETTVPTGYTQDTRTYNYTFSYINQYTPVISKYGYVYNSVKTEPFEIIKISSDTNDTAQLIENAEFTVILKKYVEYYGSFEEALKNTEEYAFDEWCVMTTDEKGYAISDRLAWGTYVVRETYVPKDTIIGVKDFEVTLTNDSNTPTQNWKVENDLPFSAYFKLVKRDELSGKTVIFSNATFELYKLNEDTNEWEQVRCKVNKNYYTTWTTDEEGIAYTENKLHYGTYKLTEIKTPDGFNDLDYDVIFRVSASNPTCEYDADEDAWITVDVINLQPTGTLIINKNVETVDENSGYTYLAEDIDYSKIQFKITADENIIDYSDGSYYYAKDEVVGIYSINEDGTLTVEGLPMGKYRLEEISTLDGYVLDEEIHKFEFKQLDTVTKVYEYPLELENYMTTTELSKRNIDAEFIEGCTLELWREFNEYGEKSYELVDTWVTNDRSHIVKGLSVGGKYILKEIEVAEPYVLAKDIEFTTENIVEVQKIDMIDKIVEMSKQNIMGEEIEGAELKVVDKDGNIIDSWISTKEPHKIRGLKEGETYTLYEDYAPDGYVIATEIEFTVSLDKETQIVEMTDKIVEMYKQNIAGREIEGAHLVVTSKRTKNIVDKWTSDGTPHKISGLIEGETYVLHEEYAPYGYVVATDVEFTVSLDKETQIVKMTDKQVFVSKTDTKGTQLPGATLQVIDRRGNIVDTWVSSKTPHAVDGLTEGESYILVEILSPDEYVLSKSIPFYVTLDKNTQFVTMTDKQVIVSKIDEKGEFLEDVYLQVVDLEGNIIDEWVTTNNIHAVSGLVVGRTYILKEIDAPYNYLLSEPIEFTVEDDKNIQNVVIKNIPIQLELDIDKSGIIQAQPNDEIRYDFKTLINKSNVPLDNFTWEDNLPYQYITITKLFTGTYNEDLNYDVFYKIVGSDEWFYFGTYNTMTNHCIDFSKLDGVVSDFKLCFGTVMPGFSIVEAPFIYTKVNSTVKKDDTWTNYTNLTGDYTYRNGKTEHLEDKAEWTTITYKYALKVNVLPRSGDVDSIQNYILILQIMILTSSVLNIIALLLITKKVFKDYFKTNKKK